MWQWFLWVKSPQSTSSTAHKHWVLLLRRLPETDQSEQSREEDLKEMGGKLRGRITCKIIIFFFLTRGHLYGVQYLKLNIELGEE